MRVTEYYRLDRTQATVDFVNVDVSTDNPRATRTDRLGAVPETA